MTTSLRVKLLSPGATVPKYQTEGAAGLDLHVCLDDFRSNFRWQNGSASLDGDGWQKLPTGIAVEIPEGFEGQVRGRSSYAARGWEFYTGTIDSDYRGEIYILCKPPHPTSVAPGERLAQLVIAPVARCGVIVATRLSRTERGDGGFGSTGR